jgi:hypothetical protein
MIHIHSSGAVKAIPADLAVAAWAMGDGSSRTMSGRSFRLTMTATVRVDDFAGVKRSRARQRARNGTSESGEPRVSVRGVIVLVPDRPRNPVPTPRASVCRADDDGKEISQG